MRADWGSIGSIPHRFVFFLPASVVKGLWLLNAVALPFVLDWHVNLLHLGRHVVIQVVEGSGRSKGGGNQSLAYVSGNFVIISLLKRLLVKNCHLYNPIHVSVEQRVRIEDECSP